MLERDYQHKLIMKLKRIFPECVVFKMDPDYIQGFPDLLILFNNKWACLEVKRSINAPHRPNQDYWVNKLNGMSYASFISPENEEEVLNEIQQAFQSRRVSRISRS